MEFLDRLKKRENTQYQKMQNKDYYFSEESKIKGKQIYKDKKNYVKNNPTDFLTIGAHIHGILWDAIDEFSASEQKIFSLTGEGKYYENKKQYEEAISFYQQADNQTMKVCYHDIQELIKENGPGDYLYTRKIRQRIRVCEKALIKEKTNKLELKAKSLEESNPSEAIEIYQELNKLKPGLMKYDKRIEICKRRM